MEEVRKEDMVSPYSIFNGTGYDITIDDMVDSSRRYTLRNGKTMNYEVMIDMGNLQE